VNTEGIDGRPQPSARGHERRVRGSWRGAAWPSTHPNRTA